MYQDARIAIPMMEVFSMSCLSILSFDLSASVVDIISRSPDSAVRLLEYSDALSSERSSPRKDFVVLM